MQSPAAITAFSQQPLRSPIIHPWQVMHACDQVEQALAVVEGQFAAGMRPVLVTPQGAFGLGKAPLPFIADKTKSISLLNAWRNLRRWRGVLHAELAPSTEIIHAYCFAPGMAAVRNFPVVVYDFAALLTDDTRGLNAVAQHLLLRAEIFVLTHAAAVVVHSLAARWRVLAAGVRTEDIFLIPAAASQDPTQIGPAYDAVYRHALMRRRNDPRTLLPNLQPISAAL